jgi:putative DNA primase/helicase
MSADEAAPPSGELLPSQAGHFVLPGDLSEKFVVLGDLVRGAPPSERLPALEFFARHAAALVGPRLPHAEAADRIWTFADAIGLIAAHGEDEVQAALTRGFENPAEPDSANVLSDDAEQVAPEFSDEALALKFAAEHHQTLRHVAVWAKWLEWTGTHWRVDATLQMLDASRRVCRQAASTCEIAKTATVVTSGRTVAAVLNLARADRRLASRTDDWDADPWALNTPSGVVDLRTGLMRPHRAADLLTKITAIAPDARYETPTWQRFLERVTDNDADLIGFLARMLGYAMTGLIREHALFFLYGTGANGKSTFLNVLTGILGDYHKTAAIETFTASTSERHPTDMAGLRGARAVTAAETEEGRRWAESKIKASTGGDRIAARFMRQDFFEFTPTFKLIIAGNHKPSLRSVDEAIRRRFHLIPFTVTVPPAERDEKLGEKLRAEWPGILAWMIEGCRDWQTGGLAPPASVKAATANYLEAEDTLAAWIEQAGTRDANAFELTAALFQSWKRHAGQTGEYVGSMRKFAQRLEDRGPSIGLTRGRSSDGQRGFYGLRLPVMGSVLDDDEAMP